MTQQSITRRSRRASAVLVRTPEASPARPVTWLPVVGFEDRYEVSDDGQVRTRKTRYEILRYLVNGYPSVNLWIGKKCFRKRIHWLVAAAFIGPRPKGFQVCHNNGVRADNRVENLRYGTAKDNAADRVLHGTAPVGERNPRAKLTRVQVAEIRSSTESTSALARRYGVCWQSISDIRAKVTWLADLEVVDREEQRVVEEGGQPQEFFGAMADIARERRNG